MHLLSSRLGPIDAKLLDDAVQALIGRVNRIWRQADIVWEIESITREPAQAEAEVEATLLAGAFLAIDLVLAILPRDQLFAGGWDAFLVRDLTSAAGAPGVYFPDLPAALSSEIDPSGLDDPGHILAHELGHSLGLLHMECAAEGNLMSPGCDSGDRIRLSAGQIDHARAQAQTGAPASF